MRENPHKAITIYLTVIVPTGRDEKWIHHTDDPSRFENALKDYGEKRNVIPMSEQSVPKM